MRNGEVLHGVKNERYILLTFNRLEGDWIGHKLHRNCLLKHYMEGKIKGIGRKEEYVSRIWSAFKETGGKGN